MADQSEQNLKGVIDEIAGLGEHKETVSVADIQEEVGERSFGPFLLIPALLEVSPIGGIPGLPTAIAVIIIIIAAQILFGRKHLWIPEFVRKRSVSGQKLKGAMDKVRPVARWTDKVVRHRLTWATKNPWLRAVAALCILLALTVPPLEVIPFASTAPMAVIGLFGLALTARDGLLVLIGSAASAAAFYFVYTALAR